LKIIELILENDNSMINHGSISTPNLMSAQSSTNLPNLSLLNMQNQMGLSFSKSNPNLENMLPKGSTNPNSFRSGKNLINLNQNNNLFSSPGPAISNFQNFQFPPNSLVSDSLSFSPNQAFSHISLKKPLNQKLYTQADCSNINKDMEGKFNYNSNNINIPFIKKNTFRKSSYNNSNNFNPISSLPGSMSNSITNTPNPKLFQHQQGFFMGDTLEENNNINKAASYKSKINYNYKYSFNKFNNSTSNTNNVCNNNSIINNENTDILSVNIKIEGSEKTLSLRRYDDVMMVASQFCFENKISENLVKPIVTKIYQALNEVYNIFNTELSCSNEEYLNSLNLLWCNSKSRSEENSEKSLNSLDSMAITEEKLEEFNLDDYSYDGDHITSISSATIYSEEELANVNLNRSF
jgi:hypothetical protein